MSDTASRQDNVRERGSMTAGGFTIDVEGVGSLINTLDHAEERMNRANDALKNLTPYGMGSRDIDAAGADFQDRWEYGIGKIADFTGSMVESLKQVKRVYMEIDDQAASTFGGSAAGGDGAGAPAPSGSTITNTLG
ncbi:MAG: hypothetical protein ACRDQ7_08665 [Haloechinothrix sp.]